MKFVLRYRPEVVVDLDAGRRWYEERSAGLGSDFVVECSEALARIQRNPDWVGVDDYGVRSLRIRRFPYVIHYRIEGEMSWSLRSCSVAAIHRRGKGGYNQALDQTAERIQWRRRVHGPPLISFGVRPLR